MGIALLTKFSQYPSYLNNFFLFFCNLNLQLLLTFDPVLVEKVALLLYLVMQDNPGVSRLYLSGAFFFIMMYTGGNVLPVARFLKYTHLRQAFRSEEVWCARLDSNIAVHCTLERIGNFKRLI